MLDCKDCGWDEHPVYTIVPNEELSRPQRLRIWLRGGGAYLRDQFGHVCFDPDLQAR